jgi:hypothetical protein
MRPSSLKLTHKRIHFEVAKGTDLQNYIYCSKDGDYVDNFERQWKIKNGLYKPKHIITDEQVNDCWWEKEILNLYLDHKKNYDDRTIYWVWSNKGKLGKTNFCKYLMTKYNFGFFMNAKTADIAYYANETMNEAYCINYTRSNEDKINYSALEMLKDGLIFSGKFESCAAIMDSPFIVCFANFEPEIKMLSEDRWKIINIDEKPIHKKLIKKII